MTDQFPLQFSIDRNKKDLRAFEELAFGSADKIDPDLSGGADGYIRVLIATVFFASLVWTGGEFLVQWRWAFLNGDALFPLISILVIIYLAARWYIALLRGRRYRRDPVQGGSFLRDWRYDFDENGVSAQARDILLWEDWRSFIAVFEAADHFFLMHDRVRGITVPKRGFARSAELEIFRNLIADKIGELRPA